MFRQTMIGIAAAMIAATPGITLAQGQLQNDAHVDLVDIPMLDFEALAREDALREAEGMAPRYAVPHEVKLGPAFGGTWSQPDADTLRWQLRVASDGCLSINLAFETFVMPDGAVMTIHSSDDRFSLRPITSADNNDHNEYWTPPVPDSEILIQIDMNPADRALIESGIVLTRVNVGYRGFYDGAFDVQGRSGSCNYDVHCPQTAGWENEIPCVAVISTGGSTFCTGFMINNLRNDRDPLFMTANHCGIDAGNAASLVTFWNYQDSPDGPLDCPGNTTDSGGLDTYLSGSTFLASYSSSDMTLVRLSQTPPDAWEVSYCGWSAQDVATEWSVAIHHPSTDFKRWSIDYQPSEITGYLGSGSDHLTVWDWDLGTTEPGSSGSPLFDQNHRVVGHLHGGYAACGNDLEDAYGRIFTSFDNGSNANSLQPHLDPDNSGGLVCDTLPGTGLSVTPSEDTLHQCSSGCPNPFPAQVIYNVTNNAPDPVSVTVSTAIAEGGLNFMLLDGSSSDQSFLLQPGEYVIVLASVDADGVADGVYVNTVTFHDITNDRQVIRTHTLKSGISSIEVDPEHGYTAGGPVGGPFTGTAVYRVTNTSPSTVPLRVTSSEPWITLNGQQWEVEYNVGPNGGYANITVGFHDSANDLPAGITEATVTFDNTSPLGEGDTTREITLDVGRYTYVSTDTPIAIEDNSEFTSTITIDDEYCMADVDVVMDVSHTYLGDLEIDLISPQGVTVRLHDQTGGSNDDINTTYDDDGEGTLPDGPGSLHDYFAQGVTGTWTLWVRDNASLDTGSLNSWGLKIASTGLSCPPYCEDIQTATDVDVPLDVTLIGYSTEGNPLTYIITSLPYDGNLSDPNGGNIASTPYTLLGDGTVVHFEPDSGYLGESLFTYKVNDGVDSEDALVSIAVGEVPNVDDCDQAFTIGDGNWDFDTTGATTDGPSHGECQFDGQTYHDIWYRYVACDDGQLEVSTCNAADYDTDLVIYSGDDCDNLVLLGCNDDADGCAGYTSMLSVQVIRDQAYLIRVGGWNDSDQGTGTLTIDGPLDGCDNEPCPGDTNGDGLADVNDILFIIKYYGTTNADADLNDDGIVDVNDLLLLIQYYGSC